jgi:hypothetical protein
VAKPGLNYTLGDGDGEASMTLDERCGNLLLRGRHHVAFVLDAPAKILRASVDGMLCDGANATRGWVWSPSLGDITGADTWRVAPDYAGTLISGNVWGRALLSSELVGSFRAGKIKMDDTSSLLHSLSSIRSLRAKTDDQQNNILLITVDDLRPQLGAYGMSETLTPNVDALASSGLLFQRAYCQMAVCSPSRNSFMSGRRPDTTKVWNFVGSFRDVGPTWVTMPQYFKQHGFLTFGFGKLYHPGSPPNDDFPTSWSPNDFAGLNDSYYWGNQQPIGDAGWCDRYTENNTRLNLQGDPVAWSFNAAWSCHNINDTLALNVRAFSIHAASAVPR